MIVTLKGNPISVNSMYRGRRFLTPEGKALKLDYAYQIKQQWKDKPFSATVSVNIDVYFPKKNRRDLDNVLKAVLDSLTGFLWDDDSQIEQIIAARYYDKENPRVEVEVIPI